MRNRWMIGGRPCTREELKFFGVTTLAVSFFAALSAAMAFVIIAEWSEIAAAVVTLFGLMIVYYKGVLPAFDMISQSQDHE